MSSDAVLLLDGAGRLIRTLTIPGMQYQSYGATIIRIKPHEMQLIHFWCYSLLWIETTKCELVSSDLLS